MRYGMIADDITGACDAGVQFAINGFSSHVWINGNTVPGAAEVTVISTDTRKETPERARLKVTEACETLLSDGVNIIYKKIDSTLLGNIGAELEAALDACGCDEAWVAPSFPAMGRTVIDGCLSVTGRKETIHLPSLLRNQGASERVIPFDAETQLELARIVKAAFASPKRILLAGSAGLAKELAGALGLHFGRDRKPSLPVGRPAGPLLFLVGSVNPVTTAQVGYLLRRRDAVEGLRYTADALSFGHHAVINIEWRAGELDCLPELIRVNRVRGLVFTGGDTARLACWVLNATGIHLDREIVTGIPYGKLSGGPFDGLPVATKAGGFGREDALAAIADSLI